METTTDRAVQNTTTPPVTDRKQKIKCKVSLQQNEKGFKKSVKKLFTIGLNSPKKKEFMFDYFEKRGIKVECEEGAKDGFKSDQSVSILQLKAFKLQNRVEDHKKLVCKIKDLYGSLNKAAKALKIHYCTLWNLCQTPTKTISNKRTESMKHKKDKLSQFYHQKSVTTNVPTARQSKKKILTSTYEEAHAKYVAWCDSNEMNAVPFGTFYRLKPNNVYSVCKIPENQCCCKLCQNFQLAKLPFGKLISKESELLQQKLCWCHCAL